MASRNTSKPIEYDHAALLMEAMLGKDPLDSTSIAPQGETNYAAALKVKKGPWKLGVPQEFFGEGIDPEVKVNIEKAIDWYKEQGCEIVDISLPHSELAVPVYYIVATAEASSNLARFDGSLVIRHLHHYTNSLVRKASTNQYSVDS